MYVKLSVEEVLGNFNVWAYGGRNDLVRGSGLFVGEGGVEANHHFLLSTEASRPFAFIAGRYRLEVYARVLGTAKPRLLFSELLTVSEKDADAIGENDAGLYFDWMPETGVYVPHLDQASKSFWENL